MITMPSGSSWAQRCALKNRINYVWVYLCSLGYVYSDTTTRFVCVHFVCSVACVQQGNVVTMWSLAQQVTVEKQTVTRVREGRLWLPRCLTQCHVKVMQMSCIQLTEVDILHVTCGQVVTTNGHKKRWQSSVIPHATTILRMCVRV
eukprot:m.160900 g.160900  ORF g.160900 m.160900 type:complete len:146 (-) comp14353_c0_seq3:763-1200(-)